MKKLLAALLLMTACAAQATQDANEQGAAREGAPRPNIIFVLTDDQRYDAMGFLDPVLDTPNMDRMAAGGVHFENAVVTRALCSPSRAAIMTGQYMAGHGVVDNNVSLEKEVTFFPEVLQDAGYTTGFIGK